ncbi:Uncharacterized mitochondrial protein AtMg00860, partial [Striga hermonthica]
TLHRAMGTRLEFSTAFHPQTDGQSERTIQYLEDILRAVVLDRSLTWESALPLVELTYNNSYHSTIKMVPFEALYGRKVRTPLYWDEIGERTIMGPEFIHRAAETVEAIRKHIRLAQERQKVYADRKRDEHEYAVGDHVFLKVSPMKGVIRFGKKGKLKPRYIGPFEILARVGNLAYRLALPPSLSGVHDVFHVSMLWRYVHNPDHVVDFGELQVERDLTYEEVPVAILDQKVHQLRNRAVSLVKVLWSRHDETEATWEKEAELWRRYPNFDTGTPVPDLQRDSDRPEFLNRRELIDEAVTALNTLKLYVGKYDKNFIQLPETDKKILPSTLQAPELEMKSLPSHLKYVYLGDDRTLPVIVSSKLKPDQEAALIDVLRNYKRAIGWTIADLRGISPSVCMHRILLEEDAKPSREAQRRLNPPMMEVVKNEIIKLLDVGVIYPISDSRWVSPTQVVPKKSGVTVVGTHEGELVPTRVQTGWRVCIDYRKLNVMTRKDHFPLPFIDQMLERLAGYSYYCFLDGYSGYFQIPIAPEDQEKTTFTCPFGTFAYRRMPFGLCNAPATFQRCMVSIFSEYVGNIIEVFMDDFSVYGASFNSGLENLALILKRCIETNLVLNWEKCHFMVEQGIVLGHIVSKRGIEVDKSKVDIITALPYPASVREVRSFLGHAGFYRRFIKDFSKVAAPLCSLLQKDVEF